MEDEKQNKLLMNPIIEGAKKWIKFNKFSDYIWIGFITIAILIGLIINPIGTLIVVGFYVAIFGSIILGILVNDWFIDKEKINWSKHNSLKKLSGWLCFACFFFIFLIVYQVVEEGFNNIIIEYILYLIFSIWTYLSVVLAKNNALLLLRSYLIFSILVVFHIVRVQLLDLENIMNQLNGNFYENLIYVAIIAILFPSLIIKGLFLGFSRKCSEIYKNQEYNYRDILLITSLILGIIFCYNNYFNII